MGEFNSEDQYIYYCGQESLRRNGIAIIVNKGVCLMVNTVVLEKILESPLDCKEIQPVHTKGNQSWIFIRRTDTEGEAPVPWSPNVKNWLIKKNADSGKEWWHEEKGMTEDQMVLSQHRFNRHEFEQASGDGRGQGSLVCCSPWGHRIRHDWATEQQQSNKPPQCSVNKHNHYHIL